MSMHVKHPLRLSSQLGLSSAMRMDDFIDEAAAPCCTKDARRFPSHVLQKCIESSSNDPSNEANYIHVNLRSIDILFEQLPSTKFIYYRNLASHINHTDTHWVSSHMSQLNFLNKQREMTEMLLRG
ncbi:hypothetical protein ACH3XW_50475 [Acanthocheilonema viteae]